MRPEFLAEESPSLAQTDCRYERAHLRETGRVPENGFLHLRLYLYGNQLREIPAEVLQLTNLRKLSLFGNQLNQLLVEIDNSPACNNCIFMPTTCVNFLQRLASSPTCKFWTSMAILPYNLLHPKLLLREPLLYWLTCAVCWRKAPRATKQSC